jgi:redox-sensitive bicupin YhaK (pirin superfamily)
MIDVRRANERGLTRTDWLDSRHTFSFGDYRDPQHMGFGALRVINEDRVRPGAGFPTHGHRDMEIVTWVLSGALQHRDSLGTGSVIRPGEIQRMSAGAGIQHSEFNASQDEPVHFLQIWIQPNRTGLAPGYEQRAIPAAELDGRLRVIAAPDGRDGAVRVHQDARILAARLTPGAEVRHALAPGRGAWVQIARGAAELAGEKLAAGDGAAVRDERELALRAGEPTELLLFDLA